MSYETVQKAKSVYYDVPIERKAVALTFDIGNGNEMYKLVLDVLSKKKIEKATFFLSSPTILAHPDIAYKVKQAGYEIGSHGHHHYNYTEYDDEWIEKEVRQAEEIIFDLTDVRTSLIRTPNGVFDDRVVKKLTALGYTTIHWYADSLDWQNPGVDIITHRVLSKAKPGAIILLHASVTARQTPCFTYNYRRTSG